MKFENYAYSVILADASSTPRVGVVSPHKEMRNFP
jgi:hypothetical protein